MATKSAKNYKMVNAIALHEGETLRLLIKRAGFRVDEFAKELDMNPNSLSRIFRSEKLTNKVKASACRVLGVDSSVFEQGTGYLIPEVNTDFMESSEDYESLLQEVERLTDEVKRLSAEVAREKDINKDLRKLLIKISGAG